MKTINCGSNNWKNSDLYIQGQVDMLFDITMDSARKLYYEKGKWDSQKEINIHIDYCLTKLSHIFSDMEYEVRCMMAGILYEN